MGFEEDQTDIMGMLAPYLGRMYPLFPAALALYNSDYSARVRAEHDERAAASGIWCHLHTEFVREFGEEPGFHFLEVRGLHVLNIRDQVAIRWKKVNANGRHRNADTAQQRDFDAQRELPDLPQAAARLVMGYQPDPAMAEIERVIVRRPRGLWVSQIIEEDDACNWIDITPEDLFFRSRHRRRGADG
jgi:hypothetical protein